MIVEKLASSLLEKGLTLSTVESCTGGGIANICTDIAGSSQWFQGGVVTYSNEMKVQLGVSFETIQSFGAVSQSVVEQMAICGRKYCNSSWSIAVSGIAGPGGGSVDKPVGTVWLAWAGPNSIHSEHCLFDGDRSQVRKQAIEQAINQLLKLLE